MPNLLGGEALPRHHFEDRPGRADANAFAAPGAARLVRIAIGADDDLRVFAAEPNVQHADHLNIFARAHAPRAEDARGHVVADHRIAWPLVAGPQRQVTRLESAWDDVVFHEGVLELVPRIRATALAEVIRAIALGKEPRH